MCCAFFWLDVHPQLLLLLAFNRDEFLGRPTEPLHIWDDTDIIGGRDRVNGGTWLGLTRSGRFAFVTNFRELHFDAVHDALSRGALPTAFLTGSMSPEDYCADLNLQRYNGFNLVVGDLNTGSAVQVSNRVNNSIQKMGPGLHGVSNGKLGAASWPKVQAGEAALWQALQHADLTGMQLPWGDVFAVLDNSQHPEEKDVPRTGVDWEMDLQCSSIFVPLTQRDGLLYGTRSQTVAAVWASGKMEVQEHSLSEDGTQWNHTSLTSSLTGVCKHGGTSALVP